MMIITVCPHNAYIRGTFLLAFHLSHHNLICRHLPGCLLEWAIHSGWLKLGLTIVAYILMNVSRSLLVGAVIKFYWYVLLLCSYIKPPTTTSCINHNHRCCNTSHICSFSHFYSHHTSFHVSILTKIMLLFTQFYLTKGVKCHPTYLLSMRHAGLPVKSCYLQLNRV